VNASISPSCYERILLWVIDAIQIQIHVKSRQFAIAGTLKASTSSEWAMTLERPDLWLLTTAEMTMPNLA
jgi:hypothetical protein